MTFQQKLIRFDLNVPDLRREHDLFGSGRLGNEGVPTKGPNMNTGRRAVLFGWDQLMALPVHHCGDVR